MKNLKRIGELVLLGGLARYLQGYDFDVKINNGKIEFIVADIACDHGFIGYEMLKNNIADKVIFSDISAKSLEKAVNLIKNSEFLQNCQFKVGDGLTVLDSDVFMAVIAGVGGREIIKILKNEKVNLSKFYLLQTSQDDVALREYLRENENIQVLCDKCMMENGHIYHTFLISYEKFGFDIDDAVLEFFKKNKLIFKAISHKDVDNYKKFNSRYFGKNNLFINTNEHALMIKWLTNRYKNILNNLDSVDNCLNGEIDRVGSIDCYKRELKERLDALDKIMYSAL